MHYPGVPILHSDDAGAARRIWRVAGGHPGRHGSPGKWGGTWSFDDSAIVQTLVDDWDTERNTVIHSTPATLSRGDPNDATPPIATTCQHLYAGFAVWSDGTGAIRLSLHRRECSAVRLLHSRWHQRHRLHQRFRQCVAQVPTSRTTPTNGWDFIHRWTDISNMVNFNIAVHGTSMNTWTVGTNNQIAFSRAPASSINSNGTVTAGAALGLRGAEQRQLRVEHDVRDRTACGNLLQHSQRCPVWGLLHGRCRRRRRQW